MEPTNLQPTTCQGDTNDFQRLVEQLRPFRHVLVSGPQRSGTTFAASILSRDLGKRNVDEREINWICLDRLHRLLRRRFRSYVIQCPCLASMMHLISSPQTAIVFMIRDVKDIEASQQRVGWKFHRSELARYFRIEGSPAAVKYEAWEQYQKPRMRVPYFELPYDAMKAHPSWRDQEQRRDFHSKQTS